MAELPFTPLPVSQDDVTYAYGPDSSPRPGVAAGDVHELVLEGGIRFADTTRGAWIHTTRGAWIHTPHGHDPDRPAAVRWLWRP